METQPRIDASWTGVPADHVVAVVARLLSGKEQIGSGYLIGPNRVLTAEHCTRDKITAAQPVSLTVIRKSDGAVRTVRSRLTAVLLDLAVLELAGGFSFDSPLPVRFGRVERAHGMELADCEAIGYPLFQLEPGIGQRNSAQLCGVIRTSDESETGRLLLRDPVLTGVSAPGAIDTARSAPESPWGGLSGALVFHRGLALGVMIQHHPRQGPSSALLTAVDTLASADDPEARALAQVLGLPNAGALPVARPKAPEPILVTSVVSRPNLLPIDDVDLIGRDDDIQAVTAHLTLRDDVRAFVVISGMPGVGKSALALKAAYRIADWYPDGQLFVSLRGASSRPLDPARVLADFLRALGVGETAIPETLDERGDMYRSRLWGRRVLVVLDDAGSEDQVRPLLPGGPTCGILVTSRKRFPALGGYPVTLGQLSPAGALALLRGLVGERVDGDLVAATEIARLCGYLPLALRIAGARLALRPGRGLAAFGSRLADERGRLDELETPDSAVRATLQLSVEALDPADREAFIWLGVLEAADFTAWRLAVLLDVGQRFAERRIESLLLGEMVSTARSREGPGERFRMHDLLRLYARELVEAEQPEEKRLEALRRTTRSFLYLAMTAAAALEPGEDFSRYAAAGALREVDDPELVEEIHERPLSWFSVERQTLVIAAERMAAQGAHDLVIALARSMTTFFDYHSHWDDWSMAARHALTSARVCQDRDAEAALLRSLARLHRYRGELVRSNDLIQQSLAVARTAENDGAVAESLVDSIRLDWYRGRHAEAHDAYDEAMRYFSQAADDYGRARCWASIALVLQVEGRIDEAVERCEAALELFRRIGDRRWIAATLTALADALRKQRRPADAERRIREALPLLHDLGFRWWEAVTLRTLGLVHADQGHLEKAEACLRTGVAALHELNLAWWESVARVSLADVLRQAGRHSLALEELRPAESEFRQREDHQWIAIAAVLRIRVVWEECREAALDELTEAQQVLAERGERVWLSTAERIVAEMRGKTAMGRPVP